MLDFGAALQQLEAGNPVARQAWEPQDGGVYVEPRFTGDQTLLTEYPYITTAGDARFRLEKWNDEGLVGPYEPTEEDKMAEDWLIY